MEQDSWDASSRWYDECVGDKGHHYHQSLIFPKLLKLCSFKEGQSVLDLGCGQGVFSRVLPKVLYCGIDSSKKLIQQAKKREEKQSVEFHCNDVSMPLPLKKRDFEWIFFILSLQNIEKGDKAILNAAHHLHKEGRIVIVLNHPCFRIPRQSHWGVDPHAKLQYRRMNSYMSEQKIPIQTNPSKEEDSSHTYSYHHPLSSYSAWFKKGGLSILQIEEWCSDKKSEGGKAKMENRARNEFPLFLTFVLKKKKCGPDPISHMNASKDKQSVSSDSANRSFPI